MVDGAAVEDTDPTGPVPDDDADPVALGGGGTLVVVPAALVELGGAAVLEGTTPVPTTVEIGVPSVVFFPSSTMLPLGAPNGIDRV